LHRYIEVIVKLVKHGAGVDHESRSGRTALIAAAFAEQGDAIRVLLGRTVQVDSIKTRVESAYFQ